MGFQPAHVVASNAPIEVKGRSGKIAFQVPPKTYSREELLALSSKNENELTKVFANTDWIKSGKLATLDNLPQGEYYYLYSRIIGFNDAATEIRIAYSINYKNRSDQVMIGTWTVASKELQELIVLDPQTKLRAVSPDQHWLAIDRAGSLMVYNATSGEAHKTLMPDIASMPDRKGYDRGEYDKVSFSADSRYLTTSTLEGYWSSDKVIDERKSPYSIDIFAVASGKYLKRFSKPLSEKKMPKGEFSPDGSRFFIYWDCLNCGSTSEGQYMEAGDWRPIDIPNMNKIFENDSSFAPEFSGDSRYLSGEGLLFDLEKKKQIKGYKECSGSFGRSIIGSDLSLYIGWGKFEYRKVIGKRCVNVSKSDIPPDMGRVGSSIVFSKDLKKIANLYKDPAGRGIFEVVDSLFPSDKVIAQAVAKAEKKEADRDAQSMPAVKVLVD